MVKEKIKEIIEDYTNLTLIDPLNKFNQKVRLDITTDRIVDLTEKHCKEIEKQKSLKYKIEKNKKRHEKKKILIDEYCKKLKELAELNSELYNMTELYEDEFMLDYDHELFTIFKNKVGYYTRLHNKIRELN